MSCHPLMVASRTQQQIPTHMADASKNMSYTRHSMNIFIYIHIHLFLCINKQCVHVPLFLPPPLCIYIHIALYIHMYILTNLFAMHVCLH